MCTKARELKFTGKWDDLASEGLTDSKLAAYYLEEAFKDGPQLFLVALKHLLMARGGLVKIAKKSGMSLESLTKLLLGDNRARWSSVTALLSALGIKVAFSFVIAKPKTKKSKNMKRKSLADTLIDSAKELKFNKATIDKLTP